MTKNLHYISFCIMIFAAIAVHSQSFKVYGNLIRIQSDSGIIRGELYETHDSAISVLLRNQHRLLLVPANQINRLVIKSKAPVLIEMVKSTLYTALFTEFLITCAYIYNACHHDNIFDKTDPSYWQSIPYGLATGAMIGFTGQLIETLFIRIRIPINKNQHVFENNRSRLNKKSTFQLY